MLVYAPSSLSVPDTEDLTSDSTELLKMLAQSATWKTKFLPPQSWSKILKKADWMTRLFGPISRRLMLAHGGAELMQSWAGTLASRSVSPENEKAQRTHGTCGHTSQESLTLFGQKSASSKTSGATFDWDCPKCLENSEELATELGQAYSRRRKSAHRTDGSECLSWPTPRAATEEAVEAGKRRHSPMLSTVVTQQLWPTASARDWKDSPGMNLDRPAGRGQMNQLPREVFRWMSSSASECSGGRFAHNMAIAKRYMKKNYRLSDQVLEDPQEMLNLLGGQVAQENHSTNGKSREPSQANSIPPGSPS